MSSTENHYLLRGDVLSKLDEAFGRNHAVTQQIVKTNNPETKAQVFPAISSDYDLDGGPEKSFWPHQAETIIRGLEPILKSAQGIILADSVGAGKTAQALGIFIWLMDVGLADRLVICVSETVMADWEEAIQLFEKFKDATLFKVMALRELYDNKLDPLPKITLIKQTVAEAKLRTVECNAKLAQLFQGSNVVIVSDESPNTRPVLREMIEQAIGFKIFMSGTIVSSSLYDIAPVLSKIYCNAKYPFEEWLASIRDYLKYILPVRDKKSAFAAYSAVLNLAATAETTLHMRDGSQLQLNIPPHEINYHVIDSNGRTIEPNCDEKVSDVFSQMGANVHLTQSERNDFQHKKEFDPEKYDAVIKLLQTVDPASVVLIVFSSQERQQAFKKKLTDDGYEVVNTHQKTMRKNLDSTKKKKNKIQNQQDLDQNNRPKIILTEWAQVEGFNVQNYGSGLNTIIFADATKDADTVAQAIGRGVRPREKALPDGQKVQIHMLCWKRELEIVQKGLSVTLRAKALLWALVNDPIGTWNWITEQTKKELLSQTVLSTDEIERDILQGLTGVISELNNIQKCEDPWLAMLDNNSVLLSNPYLFANFNYSLSAETAECWQKIYQIIFEGESSLKQLFLNGLQQATRQTLWRSKVLRLALSFNCLQAFIKATILRVNENNVLNPNDLYMFSMILQDRAVKSYFSIPEPDYKSQLNHITKYDFSNIDLEEFSQDCIRELFEFFGSHEQYMEIYLEKFCFLCEKAPNLAFKLDTLLKYIKFLQPYLFDRSNNEAYRQKYREACFKIWRQIVNTRPEYTLPSDKILIFQQYMREGLEKDSKTLTREDFEYYFSASAIARHKPGTREYALLLQQMWGFLCTVSEIDRNHIQQFCNILVNHCRELHEPWSIQDNHFKQPFLDFLAQIPKDICDTAIKIVDQVISVTPSTHYELQDVQLHQQLLINLNLQLCQQYAEALEQDLAFFARKRKNPHVVFFHPPNNVEVIQKITRWREHYFNASPELQELIISTINQSSWVNLKYGIKDIFNRDINIEDYVRRLANPWVSQDSQPSQPTGAPFNRLLDAIRQACAQAGQEGKNKLPDEEEGRVSKRPRVEEDKPSEESTEISIAQMRPS